MSWKNGEATLHSQSHNVKSTLLVSRSGGIQLFVTVSQSRVLSAVPVVVRSTLVSAHSLLPSCLQCECAHTVSESLMRIDDMHFARAADFALGLWSREWRGVRAERCVLLAVASLWK